MTKQPANQFHCCHELDARVHLNDIFFFFVLLLWPHLIYEPITTERERERERANNLKSAKPANLMKYTAFCDNDKAEMTQWPPVFIIVFIGSFIASCSVSVALLQFAYTAMGYFFVASFRGYNFIHTVL